MKLVKTRKLTVSKFRILLAHIQLYIYRHTHTHTHTFKYMHKTHTHTHIIYMYVCQYIYRYILWDKNIEKSQKGSQENIE